MQVGIGDVGGCISPSDAMDGGLGERRDQPEASSVTQMGQCTRQTKHMLACQVSGEPQAGCGTGSTGG